MRSNCKSDHFYIKKHAIQFGEYPYVIRKRTDEMFVSEHIHNGDTLVTLSEIVNERIGRHKYFKHRHVTRQFIPNSNIYTCLDHININPLDNRIENLRWCILSENSKNGISNIKYEFFNEISDDAIVVKDYRNHSFENYWYVPE